MVLTESQKEIQRKRKISAAVTKKQTDKGTAKRKQIDRMELARARAKRVGKVAVYEGGPDKTISQRTPEQAATIPSLPEQERLAVEEKQAKILQTENVGLAEQAGAFVPLPDKPIETIEGEEGRGNIERFKRGLANSGFGKALNYIDTLGGLADFSPVDQQQIIIEAQKQQIVNDIDDEIDKVDAELNNQFVQMGIPAIIGAGFVGGAVADIGVADIFFSSEKKVQNLKGSIETLNQMSTTISTGVNDGSISGRDGLKAINNVKKILDLRRQQIKEVVIGSPALRVNNALIEIDTDLFEAQVENQLELNSVANVLVAGQAEATEAQLLITKRRLDKNE